MKKIRYSKTSNFYKNIKSEFFLNNNKLLENAINNSNFLKKQPRRNKCKLCCAEKNSSNYDFKNLNIDYFFCSNCNHLNGMFEDSDAFNTYIYTSEDGKNYATNYLDNKYFEKVLNIYEPKLDFLLNNLPAGKDYSILDFGCGAGYFVFAGIQKSLDIVGFDINETMISYGNHEHRARGVSDKKLKLIKKNDFNKVIEQSDKDIIVAIGVIEHLEDIKSFVKAFETSRSEYLFFSVPMFSLSVIVENIFPKIFPRQLSNGHTHLFTNKSLNYFTTLLKCEIIAEWRFGSDIHDLFRSIQINLIQNESTKLYEEFESSLYNKIDSFQELVDKSNFCSEIHCILKKC